MSKVKKAIACLMAICSISSLVSMPVMAESEKELYVSLLGDDSNSGTIDKPFKTLEAAKAAAQNDIDTKVTILVREGNYYLEEGIKFTEEDSRSEEHPLTVKAYPGETVRFIGGKNIDVSKFSKVTDGELLERMPVEARGKVYALKLSENEYDLGHIEHYGTYYLDTVTTFPDVFVNGNKITNARWPNNEYAYVGTIINPGSTDPKTYVRPSNMVGAVMEFSNDRMARWVTADQAWLYGYWTYNWDASALQIKNIDLDKRTLETIDSSTFGVKEGQRFYAFNLLEELDVPGEYYIDRKTRMLYYYPITDLAETEMMISQLDEYIIDVSDCKNVSFEKLIIENSKKGNVNVDTSCENICFNGCILRGTSGIGAEINGINCGVINSSIYNTGAEGFRFQSNRALDKTKLELSGNYCINNDIHDCGERMTSSSGIRTLGGINGVIIKNNKVYACPAWGISASGFLSEIEYNEIFDVLRETEDAGAIYCGRKSQDRGMSISYNYIHDIHGEAGMGTAVYSGIYLDDYEAGVIVKNNIIENVPTPVYGHHGAQNVIENNIFINKTTSSNGSVWWTNGAWYAQFDVPSSVQMQFWNNHAEIDWTKEPYASTFPDAKKMVKENALDPFDNSIKNNIIVNHMGFNIAPTVYEMSDIRDNYFSDDDPGFVDYKNKNFTLRPDSEVYNVIPDFENIDMNKIGLYDDPMRSEENNAEAIGLFCTGMPKDGEENVAPHEVKFAWEQCNEFNIDRYRLVIAEDENFTKIVKDMEVTDASVILRDLSVNKTYYWKVGGVRGRGENKEVFWNIDGVKKFTTSHYFNNAKANKTANVKISDMSAFLSDTDGWKAGSCKSVICENGSVIFKADQSGVGGYEGAYTDYNTLYHFSTTFDKGKWYGLALHSDNTSQLGWVHNSHYLVIIKPDAVEFHKYPESFSGAKMLYTTPKSISFEDGEKHDIVFGTYVVNGENYIIFAIDGEIIYKVKDTFYGKIEKDGYFSIYAIPDDTNEATLTIGAPVGEMPEISFKETNLPDEYTKALTGGIAMKAYSPRVYVDLVEEQINEKNSDITPLVKNDVTLVPLRFVSESLGAEVEWNDSNKTITVTKDNKKIVMTAGSKDCEIDGETVTMQEAPVIKEGTTYLPLRFTAELLEYYVHYDNKTRLILIIPEENKESIVDTEEWMKLLSEYVDFGKETEEVFPNPALG